MKKLWTNNLIKNLSIIGLILSLGVPAMARTSLDSYRDLFESWGYSIDTIQVELPSANVALEEKSASEVKTPDKNKYLLLLSSRKNVWVPQYNNVILICDTYDLSNSALPVPCTSRSVLDTDFSLFGPSESSASYELAEIINPVNVNGTNYYVIPEILLTTPEYRVRLGSYFKALAASKKISSQDEKDTGDIFLAGIKKVKDSTLFESSLYAFVILAFVLVARRVLTAAVYAPKKLLQRKYYAEQLRRPLDFIVKNHDVLLFVFLVLAALYVPIFYALGLKSILIGEPTYATTFITNTLNPENFPQLLMSKNIFRIGFLIYNFLLGLFGLIIIFPGLDSLMGNSITKFESVKLRRNFIKWLIPAVIVINVLSLTFLKVESVPGILSVSLVILFFALLYIKDRKVDYSSLFSKQELYVTLAVMGATLVLNIAYPIYISKSLVQYSYEPLVGAQDEVSVFPYGKKWGERVLFEPFYYDGNSKIFAGGHLIYYPQTQAVINKPLSNLEGSGNFLIVSGKFGDIVDTLLNHPSAQLYLGSSRPTTVFSLNKHPGSKNTLARISLDCAFNLESSTVKLDIFRISDYTSAETTVVSDSVEILKFPGCPDSNDIKTFEVPIETYLLLEVSSIVRITGIDERALSDFELIYDGQEEPVYFLNQKITDKDQYSILYESPGTGKNITAYSTEVEKEFSVDTRKTEQGFDLSTPINELMKLGALNNPFIIWTDKGVEVIQR